MKRTKRWLLSVWRTAVSTRWPPNCSRRPDACCDDDRLYQVILDNYPHTIALYKDGSYSGFYQEETLYYNGSNCGGNPYVRVITTDNDKYWWTGSLARKGTVKNNGNYYSLSDQLYKMPSTSISFRSSNNDATCINYTDTKDAYKLASLISVPDIPIFTPPITLEGYTEESPYSSLPNAF